MPRRSKTDIVSTFRREQILDAARQCFARQGVARTTVDQIARAAGVAKGTVYLYYRSKDAILRHALTEGLVALRRETVPAIESEAPLEQQLERFFRAMLSYFDRHRAFIELWHSELSAPLRTTARRELGAVYAAQAAAWRRSLTRAARGRRRGPVPAQHAARGLVSLAHGLAIHRLKGWTSSTIEEDVAHATALVWKGLLTR